MQGVLPSDFRVVTRSTMLFLLIMDTGVFIIRDAGQLLSLQKLYENVSVNDKHNIGLKEFERNTYLSIPSSTYLC